MTRKQRETLDKKWANLVKERDRHMCVYCGNMKRLNSHHIYSRSNFHLRWVLVNGITLCPLHHALGNMSAHKSPMEFIEWLTKHKGEDFMDMLMTISRGNNMYDRKDYDSVCSYLSVMEKIIHNEKWKDSPYND